MGQNEIIDLVHMSKVDVIEQMKEVKEQQKENELTQCMICFDELLGKDKFLIVVPCLHSFCKECMVPYCSNLIQDGQVDKLICPEIGCGSHIREIDM